MKKRFIAGAICPKCQERDTLVINTIDQSIECVDCGFLQTESQRDQEAQHKKNNSSIIVNDLSKKVKAENIIPITNMKK